MSRPPIYQITQVPTTAAQRWLTPRVLGITAAAIAVVLTVCAGAVWLLEPHAATSRTAGIGAAVALLVSTLVLLVLTVVMFIAMLAAFGGVLLMLSVWLAGSSPLVPDDFTKAVRTYLYVCAGTLLLRTGGALLLSAAT